MYIVMRAIVYCIVCRCFIVNGSALSIGPSAPFILLLHLAANPNFSRGYGGKYGVQTDRQDASAAGFDYDGKTAGHASQTFSDGYGGKFGVSKVQDKSALGFEADGKTEAHSSQTFSHGYGGKFGVEKATDKVSQQKDEIAKVGTAYEPSCS